MNTFRWTMPQPGASNAEKLNRKIHLAEQTEAAPPKGVGMFCLGAIFLIMALIRLNEDLDERTLSASTILFLLIGLERTAAFIRIRQLQQKHLRNVAETHSEQRGGNSGDNCE